MDKLNNTKSYGDYAVSLATVYFLSQNYQVLFPYGDRGNYDLAIEKESVFQKIQCKWKTQLKKPQKYYRVSLHVCGSYRKENHIAQMVVHKYTKEDFDLLWVATPISCYLIPSKDIFINAETKSDLKLYPKWDKYIVFVPIPQRPMEDDSIRLSPRLTNSDKMLIKRLLKENKTHKEISDILNVSKSCISVQVCRDKDFYKP